MPFLRAKKGEFIALKNLEAGTKKQIAPFFDIDKPGKKTNKTLDIGKLDRITDKTLDEHFADVVKKIYSNWGDSGIFYVDIPSICSNLRTTSGEHCLEYLHRCLDNKSLNSVLVCALDRDEEFIQVFKKLLIMKNGRMCLRLFFDDIGISIEELGFQIGNLLSTLNAQRKKCDLVLDLKIVNDKNYEDNKSALIRFFEDEYIIADWHSITIAASSFPNSLSSFKKGAITTVERKDFLLWQSIYEQRAFRNPTFGDYGIVAPNFTDQIDYKKMKMSIITKIRYTTDFDWIVVKAENSKTPRLDHYRKLSKKMAGDKLYMGADYSWGDTFVSNCALEKEGSGDLAKWVGVDWNHHITHVVNQLSKKCGFSG